MPDMPHPRGIGSYRRIADSASTPSTPAVQANVVWPPPDDEVDRVIGVGRPGEPGDAPLPSRSPDNQAPPAAHPAVPAANPATADEGFPEAVFETEQERVKSPAADAPPDERAAPGASVLALDTVSRANAGGAAAQAEGQFSLRATTTPSMSPALAFPASGDRRGRRAGVLGIVAAVALLLFTLPSDLATLVVQSEPVGATVIVNGISRGETPFEAQFAPGEYVVEIRRGERTWKRPVTLRAGVQVVNYFALGDESAPATASRAPTPPSATDSPAPPRVAKASVAETGETGPTTLRAVARAQRTAPHVARDSRRGWLVVAPARRLTLLADGELLDLVAAGEQRRFALAPGVHELELVYESGARETRQLRIDAGRVSRLHADAPGRAVISTEAEAAADLPSSTGSVDAQTSDASRTAPPRPRDQSLPPFSAAPFPVPQNARAIVELQIDERGRVARATFQRSINSFYDQRLLGALQNWRYEPALRNGEAVASTDVVEIAAGPTQWSIRR